MPPTFLATQKPVLQAYVMDQIFDKLERGEAWAAPYYAGDYLTMVEENPDLAFSFPEEGFNIFIDAMCIPKGCQNKEGAEAFINFLCRPDVSAANLDYIGYSTPETAAKEYMDEEVIESPVSYPDDETLARSESFAELGIEATQTMNDLWLSVKTEGANTTLYLALTIAAVAAVIAFTSFPPPSQGAEKQDAAANGARRNKSKRNLRTFGGSFLLSMENPQKTHSTAFLCVLQQFNIPAVLADDRAQDRGLFLELIDPALRRERF